jgi:phosphoglycolate phosphatase-like HAD superfamily hydrolase
MAKTLLLWDIDGTLLASGGAGIRAFDQALQEEFGVNGSLEHIAWAGRTDGWIAARVLESFGLLPTPANVTRLIDGYLARLPPELDRTGAVLPGVAAILEAGHHHPEVVQGLLTGNVERGARVKLGHYDLWRYFAFGAFADDSTERNELGPHALRRAAAHAGADFAPERVWIIGDTIHDINCARVIGARALAVTTGHNSRADLVAQSPDHLLDSLDPPQAFWAALGLAKD